MPNDKLQQAASKFNQTIQGVYPELVIKNPESKEEWDNAILTLKKKGINTAKVESVYGLFENSVEPSKPIAPKNMVEPDLSTEEGKKQYYDTKGAGTRLIEGIDAGFNQLTGGVRVATGNIAKEATGEAPLERVSRAIDLGRIPQGKTIPEYEALLAQREKEFDDLEKRRAEKYKFIRKENPFTGNPTINTGEVAIPSPAWTETDAEIQRQAEDWDKRAGYDEKRYEIDNLRSYIDLAKKEGVSGATAKAKEAAKTKSWGDEVIAQGVKDIEVDAPKGTGLVYNVGNFLPQVAPIVASAAAAPFTGGTSLGWIPAAASGTSMAALSYSSAGQFMHEYDQYTSNNGIEPDQGMKFGGAAAYAAFEIIGEKLALDAAVKKMTSQYIKKSVVAGVPNKAMDLLQTYLEKNPTMAKKFVSAAADYADNGFSEATSEAFTSIGQDITYNLSRDKEFQKDFKEVLLDAYESAKGGFMMAGVTSPMIRASQQYLKNKGIRKNGITIVEDKVSGTPYQFLEANDDGSVLVTDKLGSKKKIPAENIGRVQKYDAQTYQDLVIQHKEGKQITILNPGDVIAESNEEQVSNNFGKFADQSGNLTIGTDDQGNQYFVTDIDDKTYGAVNAATGEKITIAKTSISLAGNENLGIIAANSISESVYKAGYLYGGNGKAVSIQEAIADAVSKGQTIESMAGLANEHMQLAAKSIQANDMNGATENTIKANFYTNLAKSLADATPKTEVVAGGTTIFNGKQHNVVSVNNGIAELEEITEDGLGKSFDVPIQEIQAQSTPVVNPTVPEVEKPAQEPVIPEDVKTDNQVVEQVKEPVPTEPKTYDIEVGKETVKAVQQDNGTFLLDKVYSKSEIEKASKLVETLNKDYEDNGLTFEITPLPKKDSSNPFEKPTFAVVAKPIEVVAEDVAPIQEEVKPEEIKPAVETTTPITESAVKETPVSVVEEPVAKVEQSINEAPKEGPTKLDDTIKQLEVIAEGDQVDKNPTEAQKEAGNYKKGHTTIQGFEVTIENPEGSKRSGTDGGGNRWETTMKNAYGYFKRTKGKDGDQVDFFLGNNPETGRIFVVDQMDTKTGEFDEHKVMLGFNSEEEAKAAYQSNYSKGWDGLGAITEMGHDEFKSWLKDGTRTKQPAAYSSSNNDAIKEGQKAPMTNEEVYSEYLRADLERELSNADVPPVAENELRSRFGLVDNKGTELANWQKEKVNTAELSIRRKLGKSYPQLQIKNKPSSNEGTTIVPIDPTVSHNNLVKQVKNYNGLTKYQRGTKANRRLFKTLSTLATNLGYDITTNTDGSVNVTKEGSKIRTITQKKTKEEINAHKLLTEYPQEFQDFANFIMGVDNLGYIDVDMDKKAVSQGIKNIKEGKKTVAANALLDELSAIYNLGEIHLSNNGEGTRVSLQEFRNLYSSEEKGAVEEQQSNELFEPTEDGEFVEDYNQTLLNAIADNSITKENVESFDWLLGEAMLNDIKTILYETEQGNNSSPSTGSEAGSAITGEKSDNAADRGDAGTTEVGSVEQPGLTEATGSEISSNAENPEQVAEEGLTELQKSEIEAKTGELSRKIEAKRAELVAERGKLQAKKNELEGKKTTQTSLFGEEKPQFAGQLFDIPADFSQGNITRALKSLKDGITIKEKELTELVTKRDEIIANIVSNAKSQQELNLSNMDTPELKKNKTLGFYTEVDKIDEDGYIYDTVDTPYTGKAYEVKIDYDDNTGDPIYLKTFASKDEAVKDFESKQSGFNDFQTKTTDHGVYLTELDVNNGEIDDYKDVDYYTFGSRESTATDLDYDVRNWLHDKLGRETSANYDTITLGENKNGDDVTLQIRVKDHSENPRNKGAYSSADNYLSIVIANKNETRTKFHSNTELYFDGDNTIDEVKDSVTSYIQDVINNSDVVSLSEELKNAGFTVDNATAQQELKLAAEPEKKESAYQIPSSFTSKTISEFSNELDKGNIDVETFKKAFEVFMSSKYAIIEELTGKTKAELLSGMNAMGKYRYKNEKKDAIVRAIYDSNLMTFSFGTLSWSHGQSVEDVIRRKVEKTTQEDIDKNVEEYNKRVEEYKARAAEYKKALTNPETIAEFGIFIAKNGKDALSVEQKAAYDNLITDKVLDKRSAEAEKKAEVSKVEIGDTGMNLIETKHTKTGEPIFVVTLSNRVDADTYKDLNAKAKKLGGYYSSFRGNGAIPGFTFKDKAQAENFMALKEGDVSTFSEEVKTEETKFKADKLRDAAQKMIEKANESLGRERLTNTYKRANEASRADANANEEKRIAETMINIADAIDAGNVKLLNGVKAKTHIELLEMMVRTSKNQEIAAKYPNDRIKHKDDPATLETIEYLRFGYYPSIYGRAIVDLANKASRKSGFKQVAARWEKKLSRLTEYENYQVTSDREVEELTDMFNSLPENERTYSQVGNSLANHKRLKAMGIENDAMLRAVLREYIQYRGKAKEADKVKELERAIVGRNVGFDFFPTPSSVAELMVDEAGITKGMDVLEPSAGNGNIADAVKNADVIPDVIELSSELSKILEAKGYPVVGSDFMSYNEKQYDRIVMNPPFSNGADGDHVMHAYELLKPGGRIVAIVGEGTFIRSDKKAINFREWLDQVNGSEEKLPQGTFSDKKLLNTTQANARMVVIDKPEASVQFRKTSPYYTNAEHALSSIEMSKATPEQWKAMLLKGGSKETELRWMNWDDFAKDKKSITKEEVQQFIDGQKVVVEEVVKGQSEEAESKLREFGYSIKNEQGFAGERQVIFTDGKLDYYASELPSKSLRDLAREIESTANTKYSQYTTPGGKNYKEVLLTLPYKNNKPTFESWNEHRIFLGDEPGTIDQYNEEIGWYDKRGTYAKENTFKSSHYEEPNIAAHVRLAEFTTKDGKKSLHVEEVQSDWAQKGKKEGFKIDITKLEKQQEEINQTLIKKYGTEAWMNKATEEEYKEWRDIDNQIRNGLVGAPDMPFKQTDQWVGLGMKWALRYAAENGFDVVTWTTGEQQADRYDLSKQIASINYKKKGDNYDIWVAGLNGKEIPELSSEYTASEIESSFGKDVAKKITESNVGSDKYSKLSGDGLKVGGEGMKAFYDSIIPSWVNKYVKKWGAKTTTTEIDTKPELTNDGINLDSGEINQPTNGKFTTVHSVEVTPSMTISVMEGQPMFRASERVFTDVTKERHHQQVSKAVNDLQEKAPNALPLRVVRNNKELSEAIKDLPKSEQVRIQEAIDAKDVISGVTTSKAVFIVSESVSDENEAIHTWIHEQASHVGLKLLIPDPYQRNQFYQQVFESVGESGFKALLDEIDPSGATYASYADESNASKGEEYMAFLSQKILNREQMTPQQYKFWSVIRQKLIDLINKVLTYYNKRSTFTDRELALIVKAGASKLYDYAYFEKPSRNDNQEKPRGANASNGSALRGDRGGILVVPEIQNTVSSPNLQALHAERAYREFDPITTRKVAHDALLRSVPNSKLERLSFGHGTNVEFSNFDIKYAGTGTGEKIHGYGLYLSITANDPAVAVTYANKVAFTSAEVRKYAEGISEKYGHLAFKAFEKATYDTKRGKDLLTSLKDRYAETGKPYIKSVIDHVESNPIPFSKIVYFGQMEKPDGTPFHFIEWDTEFVYKDQWDAITNGLNREGHSVDEWLEMLGEEALLDDGQLNGKQVYRSLAKLLAEKSDDSNGSPKNASEFLYRAGFDGTIYADKEIADGKERYNVCSFSDKPIHITETVKFRKKDRNPAEMSKLDVQIRIFADRMIAQKNVEKEILKRGGRITDASNVSMQENLSSSIASEAMKKFNREMVKPYVETIVSVMKEGNLTQEDVEKYLIAKHTPERNKTFRDLGKEGDTFSGMDEKEALDRVKDVEGKVSGKLISKLWEQTNAITKFALDYDLACGRISKETHDRYTGKDNDWKHYVPLKGWEAETLDDADYVDTGSGAFTPTLKKAKGRTSASDTPIHYMISAAYSSIAAGEKNKVKAAAVRLATNNPDMTDIFHLKKVWMVKSGLKDENGKDIYLETTDKPTPEQFNQGLVKTKIDTRHEVGKPRDKSKQEEVTAYIKGEKYTVIYEPKYVAAANAINKVTDKMTAKANDVIQGTIGIFTRWLSANFTSKSPDFILPNFVRDVSFGFMSESLKEGKGLRFLENTRKGMATIHRAYANKLDPKNPIDVHYQNWLKNGGPTGFVHLGSLESIKSNIDLEVKRLMKDNSLWDKTTQNRLFKKLGAMMDYAAIMSENASRFGVYLTSIEQGKSEAKAAHDGKEATVNFNTKGELSGIIGGFFTFFNASVQGGKTFAKLGYENKGKMAIAGASFMALGYMMAAMNRFMDDDEEYDKENQYIRENNLIFKSGKNHIMIPLPHGFRMFYALGVIINDLEHGKETAGGATRRGMSSVFSSFSPIDPVGLVDKKGDLSLRPIIPTTMIPIYDIAKNEDFAGRKIHNEPFMLSKENVLADRGLGLKNVNPFLQDASDILFELGGGELDTGLKTKIADGKESRIKGIYDLNPSDVEHIISFYTGGRGQFFNNVIKMGNSIVDQSKEYAKDKDLKKAVDGLDMNSMPILRRFYKEPWAGSNYKEFIKIRDEVEAYKATLTEYEKMMVNNVPRYIGAMTAMDLQQKAIIYESFNRSIKELNAQADNLMEYSDPSAIIEQKDQLVNQMIEQVKNIKK